MQIFRIKHLQVPLFGTIDVAGDALEPWWTTFASPNSRIEVSIDDVVLDFVADELELDADGLIASASRYVAGEYRSKAKGLGGGQLGDFGELIAYLVYRARPRTSIVRIVSWRKGVEQTVKGNKFPHPDFLVRDDRGDVAVEVKSTEAFDFKALEPINRWRALHPCFGVVSCRREALPQLGWVKGERTENRHRVVLRDGRVVPFPAAHGEAVAVLAQDGRVSALRLNPRYKTHKPCRQRARSCWTCIEPDDHVVMTTMPNEPGYLSLAGGADDNGRWFHTYRRWAEALQTNERSAVNETTRALVTATGEWASQRRRAETDILRGFWGSYLRDILNARAPSW
jgi:hypothetical protein